MADDFGIDAANHVGLAGGEGGHAGGGVVDDEGFDFVDMAVLPEVIGIFAREVANAVLGFFHDIWAGADGVVWLAVGGLDDEMIIGHQKRKIGVGSVEGEEDFVLAVGGDIGDAAQDSERAGFGVFVAVAADGGDDIGGGDIFAVAESRAAAQLKGPFGASVVGGLERFGEQPDGLAVGA